MRTLFSWGFLFACAGSVAAGCGSSGGDTGFAGDGGSSSGGSSGGASSGDGSASGGDDGSGSSSGSSSGGSSGASSGVIDASLDINFPDAFYGPDGQSSGSSSGTGNDSGGCSPPGITCMGNTAYDCSNGTITTTACLLTQSCAPGYGCVTCIPGTGSCSGNVGTACNAMGTGTVTNDCDPVQGETCDSMSGQCDGDCAHVGQSYIGCEYYAVTMANTLLAQGTFVFSVSIANTGSQTANINIQGGALTTPLTDTIAAGAIKGEVLPWVPALSMASTTAKVAGGAYHIRSTEPVTVYQFNARDYCVPSPSCTTTASGSTYSYTNDASLLLPVNAMTETYYSASYYDWEYPAYITVIGTAASTSVTVNAATTVAPAGVTGLTGTGGTVTLNAGDVLQLMTPGTGGENYGGDLSGSKITATGGPIEVFGGTDCIYIPATTQACDHTEQINFPLETLRSDYLVTVPHNDNTTTTPSKQYVKIIGTVNGTTLTYDGITGEPGTVNAGGVVTFQATSHFHLTSSQPVEIAQYMEGQEAFDPSTCDVLSPAGQTCGDPAMSLAVATAQFRTSYPFTSPPNYYQNWVNVVAPTGTTVTVTDTPTNHTVSSGTAIGSSGYYVANVPLCANNLSGCTGNHTASATTAFGIQVYGYGSATSYMYPGGLNLSR